MNITITTAKVVFEDKEVPLTKSIVYQLPWCYWHRIMKDDFTLVGRCLANKEELLLVNVKGILHQAHYWEAYNAGIFNEEQHHNMPTIVLVK